MRGPRLTPARVAGSGPGQAGDAYRRLDRRIGQSDTARIDPRSPLQAAAENSQPEYQFYRLTAHRKMGARELHYIDHPKMGVLVEVTR
jgi:hypothetical protein